MNNTPKDTKEQDLNALKRSIAIEHAIEDRMFRERIDNEEFDNPYL